MVAHWDSLAELEAVRVFAAVAELKSFRGAAVTLRLPRSTVSRRLATLEAALETRLLQRTTRSVSLTEAGEAFLTRVRPALAAIADAGRTVLDARAEPRGLLRVTATVSMAEHVGGILLELVDRYPQIRLELDFTDRHVDLVAEGYDIALRGGALADSSLIARPLGQGPSGYFASPAYLKRRGAPKVPRDLATHDCLVFSGSSRGERWRFQRGKRTEEVTVRKRMVTNALSVVRLATLAGHGIAWIPAAYASTDVARGKLVPVLASHWPPPLQMQLVYPSARHLAPQVRVAIELLLARFEMPS
ncbi:MAG: LysR family transcriptional regulator [Proteobacteria bacterium]|nr:LysR family transcriptional regulator [Pseudomonadota bacterium]